MLIFDEKCEGICAVSQQEKEGMWMRNKARNE